MEELIPTLQEEGEERIDTLAEQTIIAGVQTINGKAGDLDLKTINNTDLLTPGNINLATPTDIHNLDTAKQDKLVAGTNIQIAADGKTISATDTTYSAGSGLNLTGTTFSVDTDTIATQNDIYTLQTTKQDNLTTTQLNAVNSGIDSTKVAQIATNEGDIATINGKIPTQASTSNQLADKNFVNSSVQTATANYRGSWDDWASVPTQASDYPEDYAGSHTPTVNDYMVVQDASDYTEETLEGTWRFKYTGEWDTNGKSGWLPEYQVNETPLTAAQIAAINSGITDTLVAQISTNQSNISDLTTNKLDKNTTFWGQSVQNGAVQGTLTLTESGQNATIATSGHNTTDAGIKMGNSKNYVEAGVTEITLSSTTGGIKLKPKSGSSVDVMSSKITSLATPTANTDASTKKYVDDGLAVKQNTLTAGSNITITGDEISATDTTYTAGAGLTLTGTEFSVNDPAPSGFWTGDATESGTGTSITINNALATTPKDIKLDGDTEQISYTGKNLVNFTTIAFDGTNSGSGTRDGETFTVTSTTNSFGGIYMAQNGLALEPNTTYTFSAKVVSTTTTNGSSVYILSTMNNSGSNIAGNLATAGNITSATFTTPSTIPNDARIALYVRQQNSTTVFTNLQMEKSSSVTPYEPYVGGVASPNPSYPQDVNVVTGNQTVTLNSTVYEINLGKNLFDVSNSAYILDGLYIGNSHSIGGAVATTSVYIPCKPNQTYTVSKTAGKRFTVAYTTVLPAQGVTTAGDITDNEASSITITTGTTAKYLVAFVHNTSYDTVSKQDMLDSVQIEYGSTATTYSAYFTPIELCKIDTYQDYIWKDGSDWKIHKAVGKVVLNGTEGWGYNSTNAVFVANDVVDYLRTGFVPVCDYYLGQSITSYSGVQNMHIGFLTGTNSRTVIKNTNYTDKTTFESWLTTHNTTVYYVLATATDTTITDADLIADLEALADAQLATGQNTIISSGVSPNLDAILTIEAFNNNWNGLSQALLGS